MKHSSLAVALGIAIAALACLSLSRAQQNTGPVLSVAMDGPNQFEIAWSNAFAEFVLEATDSLGSPVNWQPVPESRATRGNEFVVRVPVGSMVRFYRLRQVAVVSTFRISRHTPLDGASEVGVTFRPQVFFSEPVNPTTLTSDNFFATAAGMPVGANIVPANDGTFAWLFFKQALPGGTRVRVHGCDKVIGENS